MRFFILIAFFVFTYFTTAAQIEISGEYRPRVQIRNGVFRLPAPDDTPSIFIAQRSRFNFHYTFEDKFETHFSFQDVRVWGDQNQLSDEPSVGVFEAWAQIKLFSKLSLKAGRQELLYDDGYLFGTLNWREAGRSHDLGIFKWEDSTFQAHLGIAFNQNRAALFDEPYTNDYYKNMQFLWLHKDYEKLSLSLMAVNRGLQKVSPDTAVNYTQTLGGDIKYFGSNLTLTGIGYYQTGEDLQDRDVSAWFWSLKGEMKVSEKLKILLGADMLSGTKNGLLDETTNTKSNTFDILYGFRHRHFGIMDYFYLGYTPDAGLQDLMLKFTYKHSPKFTSNLDIHNFYSQTNVPDPSATNTDFTSHLGVEVDYHFSYKPYDMVTVQGGYSQMFGTETLAYLKGGSEDEISNWFWLQVSIKPVLFKGNVNKQ
ncbi:alginate export family protein [Chondrinema litorale]|uniref:alginate export family protein n=1 Tax=Chondrinema litorale TaxID=2994555 RepID=UPI0025433DE5|nr:alginate export family protein [Chondrinema litorale]UZR99362.1 alginate export family protein [Chondrinema litorale]